MTPAPILLELPIEKFKFDEEIEKLEEATLHLKAIFAEGELSEEATCKDYLQVRQEGNQAVSRQLRHYHLDFGKLMGDGEFRKLAVEHLLHKVYGALKGSKP